MGKRGPKKTPLKILKSRGSWRADRRDSEPTPPEGKPKKPKGMSKAAAKIWDEVVSMLAEMGILGKCDGFAVERYCEAVALYRHCMAIIDKKGTNIIIYEQRDEDDEREEPFVIDIKERPEVSRAAKLSEECRKLENLFGLNPAARASLVIERPSEPNENRGKGRFFKRSSA